MENDPLKGVCGRESIDGLLAVICSVCLSPREQPGMSSATVMGAILGAMLRIQTVLF